MRHGPVALVPSSDGKDFCCADFSFMLGQYMLNNERFLQRIPLFAGSDNQTVEMLYHVAEAGRYNQNCHSRLPDAV